MEKKYYSRVPKNYDGTKLTSRRMDDLLPYALANLNSVYQQRGDLILAVWPQIIGEKLAPMTEAVSFNEGILFIKVKNSTLHSLLNQNEKSRILCLLREKFPQAGIKNISFRIG